ncbi:MAG: cell wall hydrolase [Lachnospiraceae bacterium]|nr:cell wall hydrolase [Lachnospiraceae bacterium]
MREHRIKALNFISVLSVKTYVWCLCVTVMTVFLCISFFTTDSYDGDLSVRGQAVKPTERATYNDQTYVIETLSELDSSMGMNGLTAGINNIQIIDTLTVKTLSNKKDGKDIDRLDNPYRILTAEQMESLSNGCLPGNETIRSKKRISVEDYLSLCKLVEAEAATEDREGKRLVANVIINRVSSKRFPDTIYDAIFETGQFEPVSRGGYNKAIPTDDTKVAVIGALNGMDDSSGALYFQKSRAKIWGDKVYLFRYGAHSFYR